MTVVSFRLQRSSRRPGMVAGSRVMEIWGTAIVGEVVKLQTRDKPVATRRPAYQKPQEEDVGVSLDERIDTVQQTALRLGLDRQDPILVLVRARRLAHEAGELIADVCMALEKKQAKPPMKPA